jgi:hypothetical protein
MLALRQRSASVTDAAIAGSRGAFDQALRARLRRPGPIMAPIIT